MKKIYTILKTLGFLGIFLIVILNVNAVYDFNVTPISFNGSLNISSQYSNSFKVGNTGNQSINISLMPLNLTCNDSNINVNFSSLNIVNLSENLQETINFNFTSLDVQGNFTGLLVIYQKENISNNKTISFNFEILNNTNSLNNISSNQTTSNNLTLSNYVGFEGFNNTLTMEVNLDDNSETKNFYLENIGNVSIKNISIELDSKFTAGGKYIEDSDFEINGESGDKVYDWNDDSDLKQLNVGDKYKVKLYLDIPSNLNVDDYKGDLKVKYFVDGVEKTRTFTLKIITDSDDNDVYFMNSLYLKSGVLKVQGEPGESINNVYFEIRNDAKYDVDDLTVKLDGNFQEEDSLNIMPASVIDFDDTSYSINDRDDEKVYFDVNIPDNQQTGVYSVDVKLYSKTGKELDKFVLKVEVIGDIYIKSIDYKSTLNPGQYLDVKVKVRNKGAVIQRNIKIFGTLFDIDSARSDIHESSSSFLLDSNSEREEILRFKIPDDASDGSHVLEIRVDYDGNQISKVEDVNVLRPSHRINIDSYAINPRVIKCSDKLYTYIKVQNLGKYDDSIKISSKIEGTGIEDSTSLFDISVDEIAQKSIVLDVSNLDPGDYKVVQTVTYNSIEKLTRISDLRIDKCSNISGIEIKSINRSLNLTLNSTLENSTKFENSSISIFGKPIEKTTVYLGGGLTLVIVLIIFTLFLL